MQRQARHDTLAEAAHDHYRTVMRCSSDGVIDRREQVEIAQSARKLAMSAQMQSTRLRLARRMISGGDMDREILGEVRDYQVLQAQEKAVSYVEYEAA